MENVKIFEMFKCYTSVISSFRHFRNLDTKYLRWKEVRGYLKKGEQWVIIVEQKQQKRNKYYFIHQRTFFF